MCAYTETKLLFGFASLGSGFCGGGADVDGVGEVEKAATRAESPKKVLILISNTGGVHRASAEAMGLLHFYHYSELHSSDYHL